MHSPFTLLLKALHTAIGFLGFGPKRQTFPPQAAGAARRARSLMYFLNRDVHPLPSASECSRCCGRDPGRRSDAEKKGLHIRVPTSNGGYEDCRLLLHFGILRNRLSGTKKTAHILLQTASTDWKGIVKTYSKTTPFNDVCRSSFGCDAPHTPRESSLLRL